MDFYDTRPPGLERAYYPSTATPSSPGSWPGITGENYYSYPFTATPSPTQLPLKPLPRHLLRHTSTEGADEYPRRGGFSPRYTSAGYYETAADLKREHQNLPSPLRNETKERSSSIYETSDKRYHVMDQLTYDKLKQHILARQRRRTTPPSASQKKPPSHGYSLKNWDPAEESFMHPGSMLDADGLVKWIHDRENRNPKPRFKQPENRRKAVRIKIRDTEHLACPDSGSEENIMSEAFATSHAFKIRRRPQDMKQFELGSGKHVQSVGRARASVELIGNPLGRKKRWFYIFSTCPVPLILGMPFLKEAEIFTKNRHLLENCPAEMSSIPSLLWIGSPRERIKCSLDGHELVAAPDTGSDLNLISLKCAKREGFTIDRRREARRRIKVGDGSETETIGQVYVYNLSLDWRREETTSPHLNLVTDEISVPDELASPHSDEGGPPPSSFGAIFHVLPNLPCDIVFVRGLLAQTDAFTLCPTLSSSSLSPPPFPSPSPSPSPSPGEPPTTATAFHILISLGPVSLNLPIPRRKRRGAAAVHATTIKEAHDDARHAEMFRRSTREDALSLLPAAEQEGARARERRRAREWDGEHAACVYCNPV